MNQSQPEPAREELIRRNRLLRSLLCGLEFVEAEVTYEGIPLTQIAAETFTLESLAEMIGIYTGQPEAS